MKIVSFTHARRQQLGLLTDKGIAELPANLGWPEILAAGGQERLRKAIAGATVHDPATVAYDPPVATGARVFCVGLNYLKEHPISGAVTQKPVQPTIFIKIAESFVGHGKPLKMPTGASTQLDYECELTVVISKGGRNIPASEALDHVFGYTLVNDGSVRDWQKHSLFSGKNFAASSSCGPHVVTADEVGDPSKLSLATHLNGEQVQDVSTGAMLYDIPALISHISTFTPLHPGDLIATGSPDGSGGSRKPQRFLQPGDRIEFSVTRVGQLQNNVI
jgi:2-keto-4-pentenoate hydratase/2-oxohepta-3-ene-1,7-dioic acid hydratase in catechol pathway